MLERRGREHERQVLELFRSQGRGICEIARGVGAAAFQAAADETVEAMRAGANVIYQGALGDGHNRPDFLVRVEGESRLGPFSYEAVDAKLSRDIKARAVLQLCRYTDLLAEVQGADPDHFWIAGGGQGNLERLRATDFLAYYRRAKRRFETFLNAPEQDEPYPEPVEYCGVCDWWKRCDDRRRADDHLSLVAGVTRRQRDQLKTHGVRTVVDLARADPCGTIGAIAPDALERICSQARLQVEGRTRGPRYELLDSEPGQGLERLPEPTRGDLFFDIEGDPFVQGGGLEYLFGLLDLGDEDDPFSSDPAPAEPRYAAYWAANRAEEKRAFESVIDAIVARREEYPGLHVFHFGHRESDALKKLSLSHSTRADEVDELLRAHVMVDLHRVARQAVRASVESYSLKELEIFHGFERRANLRHAAKCMQLLGWWLETGDDGDADADALRAVVQAYNEEDCFSTWKLREWLEGLRTEARKEFHRTLGRPEPVSGEASEKTEQDSKETAEIAARLVGESSARAGDCDDDARARRLLADLLDWHRRENKSAWWEYFRTLDLSPSERRRDRAAIGDIVFDQECGTIKRSRLLRYTFPEQDHSIRANSNALDPASQKTVEIVEAGPDFVVVKRAKGALELTALIPGRPFDTGNQRQRLLDLGRYVADRGLGDRAEHGAALDLLRRARPRCGQGDGEELLRGGEEPVDACVRLAGAMDSTVLSVQGPPGSGKTYCAVEMIRALLAQGRRVGVSANSHKVIAEVLKKVGAQRGGARVLHVGTEDDVDADAPFELSKDYADVARRLRSGELTLVGGTAWAWSRSDLQGTLHTLVIDEAGQVSLANTLAIAGAARNLVLVGDPAQLDQPQKGVHPPGADVSALEHVLGDALTMPADRGLFISKTRRLPPAVCAFTSEVFYDGRLEPEPGLEAQRLVGTGRMSGSGLLWFSVEHRDNASRSDEEVEVVEKLVAELLGASRRFATSDGAERVISRDDVLIVAPYNAQVSALKQRLPRLQIGTVDKFQGREAPVVIYSMTSSSAEDAPRGLEFLYNLNRLNVATSRTQALVVLVGSPALLEARCRTPRQMKLVNALCRYVELADSFGTGAPGHS